LDDPNDKLDKEWMEKYAEAKQHKKKLEREREKKKDKKKKERFND